MNSYICQICNKKCLGLAGLSYHIQIHKTTKQQYYDTYLKKNNQEGICKTCGGKTKFLGMNGYTSYCSHKCSTSNKEVQEKNKQTKTTNNPNGFILDLPEKIQLMLQYPKSSLDQKLKCQICQKEFDGLQKVITHVISKHKIRSKTYYNHFFKKENEGICEYCSKKTNFEHFTYNRFCSIKCAILDPKTQKKMRDTTKERYGFEFMLQSPEYQKEQEQKLFDKTGVKNVSQLESIKKLKENTNMMHRGVKCSFEAEDVKQKTKETLIENYGIDNPSKYQKFQNKKIQTSQENWGTDHPMQCPEIHKKAEDTNMEKRGVKNAMQDPIVVEQVRLTNQNRRGVDWVMQDPSVLEKSKQTNMEKRGVEWSMQDPKVRSKSLKNSFQKKEYTFPSGKKEYIQGYEPHCLDWIFSNTDIKEEEIEIYPTKIKYFTNDGKTHYYFGDIRIIPFNLIIETKDSYILSIQKNTDLKIAATISAGYKYIMVLDKKYDELKNLIIQLRKEQQLKEKSSLEVNFP